MLLSPRYRFLFVHIAKTGGTSVRAALQGLRWRDPWYYPMFLCSRMSHLSGHRIGTKLPRHAKAVLAQELLPRPFYDSLFKFAFVRNPWDLQVSSFHHIRRERPHYLGGHQEFADFLRWKLDPERPYQYHVDTSITRQSDYLVDLHGEVIVDFIGRYEQLHDDFATVCARIGITPPALPHARKATDRKRDYRSYYDDDTAELVARHFARDIELLDYRFDPD
ncbi:sulfotransferase family 2 domain-containing protein [Marichromatium gracile]|uniref:Sulfotransferase family protein n=1 Tax=Marichromatium gracile TaxID=1048 RepID=A0A4R4AL57_MARGR|nr:sulfotransferase family 2 domain-containing protein [Marichromatium gracile]MBK1710437.1 sulfotransferase [Marichromatium gracile]MBO8085504.1 sulfotransferase family 2 domain-containing protein [Marichromatium sp.]TCW39619.1 sulfotransferase family protein [Marichromatium gracile]